MQMQALKPAQIALNSPLTVRGVAEIHPDDVG
jgi:hypothetical protein